MDISNPAPSPHRIAAAISLSRCEPGIYATQDKVLRTRDTTFTVKVLGPDYVDGRDEPTSHENLPLTGSLTPDTASSDWHHRPLEAEVSDRDRMIVVLADGFTPVGQYVAEVRDDREEGPRLVFLYELKETASGDYELLRVICPGTSRTVSTVKRDLDGAPVAHCSVCDRDIFAATSIAEHRSYLLKHTTVQPTDDDPDTGPVEL